MAKDDKDDDVEEVEDDDTDDDDTDDAAEWTPPSKEDWDKVQSALKKANTSSKRWRTQAQGKPAPKPEDDKDIDAKVAAKAAEVWKPRLIRKAGAAALAEAGAKNTSRLVKLLDLDELDVDDDGDVDGLDDEIDRLKEEFPELFKGEPAEDSATRRRRVGKTDAAGKASGSGGGNKSASERQAARILGR